MDTPEPLPRFQQSWKAEKWMPKKQRGAVLRWRCFQLGGLLCQFAFDACRVPGRIDVIPVGRCTKREKMCGRGQQRAGCRSDAASPVSRLEIASPTSKRGPASSVPRRDTTIRPDTVSRTKKSALTSQRLVHEGLGDRCSANAVSTSPKRSKVLFLCCSTKSASRLPPVAVACQCRLGTSPSPAYACP
jgi:hypothetical protein